VVFTVSVDRKPEILELVNPVRRLIVEVDHGKLLRGTTSKYHDFGFIFRKLKAGLRSPRFTDEKHGLEFFRRFYQQRDVVCVQQIFDEKIPRQSCSPLW